MSDVLAERYRLERELARGGMAVVHLAHDEALDRPVAVKVLAEHLAADPAIRERFAREAQLAARLQHPNVVSVFDTGESDGRPFIVMELVEGETAAELVRRTGPQPVGEALAIARAAAAALSHAHAAGLVHRDVKPQNVIVRADGAVKLTDFGIARALEAATTLTEAGTILGTAQYLSPEQAGSRAASPASDVYGLGAVLYELLTGRPPREARSLADLERAYERPPPGPSSLGVDVPPEVEHLVLRCLAADPTERPRDGAALERQLDRLPGGVPARSVEAPTQVLHRPRAGPRVRRRVPPLAVAGALAAAAVAVALALATRGEDEEPPARSVEPVARAEDPAEQARNLSDWLRENSR